jgi:hypothetical protein
MVPFRINFLALCVASLTAVAVHAKNSAAFGTAVTNTNVTAEEVESAQKSLGRSPH